MTNPLPDLDRIRVTYVGESVGTLTMSPNRTLAFAYDWTWLTHGFSISPLSLPLQEGMFIGNRDDHAKNFSYLYDREHAVWRLSPAYDLTENPGINGEHTTAVNGKGRGITLADLAGIGVKAGIPRARCLSIAKDMRECVADAGFTVRA
ncbi:HipA domain-containing protein [Bifidobacterium stellenboschense]|uniref:HipA domain-containing protein n=1 Tax=Bifidobacterium stellenboschense TaxID=762211 RepID=A0A087DPT9_9BIFI|nr:HipA domain-containing protein [Bifidobacterium stellenboschense]KFI97539.1 HipA domain-containing protein [Bifidobacterium stellenboschense]